MQQPVEIDQHRRSLLITAWVSILLVSDLLDVLFNQYSAWLLPAKLGIAACVLVLCLSWKRLCPLRPYAAVMVVFFAALNLSEWVRTAPWWENLIPEDRITFALVYVRPFIRDTGVTLIMIAALWLIHRRREAFFFGLGQLNAPIQPIRWLGIRAGESWRTFAWIFGGCAALAVAIPTLLIQRPSLTVLAQAAQWLPVAILLAAINAFNEEIYFRSSLLSTLPQVIGKEQALLLNAAFFGLAHYLYGSPPGILGFLMTGFLAWLMGRAILETRGLLWAWLIHLLPDIVIFTSYAIGWVQGSGA